MNVYKGRLLKKSSNRKSKLVLSTLVTTWLSNIAFHLRPIWLQTLAEIDSESCQRSFQSFCAQPSEVAVLLDLNLSRRPFLRQVVDLDLLLCTGFDSEPVVLFQCDIFTQRPTMIERLSKAMCAALVGNNFSPIPSKITWKKIDSPRPDIYKAWKPCWLSNWVSFARVEAGFPQASLPAATAADSEALCVFSRLSEPPKLCLSVVPRARPSNLQSNPSIVFWNSLREWLPDELHGLELESNLNSAAWPIGRRGSICSKTR